MKKLLYKIWFYCLGGAYVEGNCRFLSKDIIGNRGRISFLHGRILDLEMRLHTLEYHTPEESIEMCKQKLDLYLQSSAALKQEGDPMVEEKEELRGLMTFAVNGGQINLGVGPKVDITDNVTVDDWDE